MSIEAMTLALNTLKSIDDAMPFPVAKHAMSQLRQAIEQSTEQEPVAFYVYKPTLPRGNLGNVSDGDLPWVYDQDSSSGYSARMLVYTTPPQRKKPEQEPVAWMNGRGDVFKNPDDAERGQTLVPLYTTPPQRKPPNAKDFEDYCKTLHPLWNTRISRTEAEGFFHAGWLAAHGIKE